MPENSAVNSKFVFVVAGGIAAAAIAIFVVLGSGLFNFSRPQAGGPVQSQLLDLQLSVNAVKAEKTDEKTAAVQVAFDVYNPNRNTAILETIHYTVYIGNLRMTSGDIGASPAGFVDTQGGIFPVIANTTLTLKDSQPALRNNVTAIAWDTMVAGNAQYRIEGSYAYKLADTSFQFSAGEKDFVLSYP